MLTPFELWAIKTLATLAVSTLIIGTTRGLLWLREVKTNHLPHLQAAMEAIPPALEKQSQAFESSMEKQTAAVVKAFDGLSGEIKEQRADTRMLIAKV